MLSVIACRSIDEPCAAGRRAVAALKTYLCTDWYNGEDDGSWVLLETARGSCLSLRRAPVLPARVAVVQCMQRHRA